MSAESDKPDLSEANLRAAAIAHTIRLGKCPPIGAVLGFNFQIQRGDESILETGDFSKAENVTGKIPVQFTVTGEDIDAALRLLESEKITFREPKLSILPLLPGPGRDG